MVQTVLGLVFLSTTFIITFLINNIQKYRITAQEIQAKYIWGENVDEIPTNEIIKDYQNYRTIRIELGSNLLICFGIFMITLSSLLVWAIDIYEESLREHLWSYLVVFFMIFVFFFELNQFASSFGDEGIIKIINTIITSKVNGFDLDFREFSRKKIVENNGITRLQLERKFRKNYLGKVMFTISQYANELSFSIIIRQFVIFYLIIGSKISSNLLNPILLIFLLLVYFLVLILYVFQVRKTNSLKQPLKIN